MGVERRDLQSKWMLNCITVDMIKPFNIVTLTYTFQSKTEYRPTVCCGTAHPYIHENTSVYHAQRKYELNYVVKMFSIQHFKTQTNRITPTKWAKNKHFMRFEHDLMHIKIGILFRKLF